MPAKRKPKKRKPNPAAAKNQNPQHHVKEKSMRAVNMPTNPKALAVMMRKRNLPATTMEPRNITSKIPNPLFIHLN